MPFRNGTGIAAPGNVATLLAIAMISSSPIVSALGSR